MRHRQTVTRKTSTPSGERVYYDGDGGDAEKFENSKGRDKEVTLEAPLDGDGKKVSGVRYWGCGRDWGWGGCSEEGVVGDVLTSTMKHLLDRHHSFPLTCSGSSKVTASISLSSLVLATSAVVCSLFCLSRRVSHKSPFNTQT
ncbi:hypothetical protein M409DRAFT_51586 [Zasmidium cellare ATCC 36951]|uniref:Uncharacterized protein n=1 Tax=Zasmidium cellare ATCC 36951 TaxID=1080233 RepID=A0A6A6CWI2_ZASCE|nr:uncharacterized protein M409DRAFT_51586 [Zasmidium cellare ATCC 36951]KAF2170568.1 hypothetical protein M409DRAFT_51586 [Zasmidium cellare ATCC 36951]